MQIDARLQLVLVLVCCRGPIASEVGGRDVAKSPPPLVNIHGSKHLQTTEANHNKKTILVDLKRGH